MGVLERHTCRDEVSAQHGLHDKYGRRLLWLDLVKRAPIWSSMPSW